MADDLLIRVDAQISQFEAAFGKATTSTLNFEKALARASAQQALLEAQVKKYGATSTQASAAQTRAAAANARLMEMQTKRIAEQQAAMTKLGTTAGKIGLVALLAFGFAAKGAADFEKSMSRVAATGDDAKQNLDGLRQAAIDFGESTQFSATESADAITELVKAGVSAQDVLGGGLKGALDLAAAGELDVATAANIAATAMQQFGLSGASVPHVADLLAAAAGKAQGEVTDMAEALKYVGPVAAQMGISIEETVGTVAELAEQGVLASQAGTSLRGMLTALTSPSAAAADEMKKLGINMYDAQGVFIGFDGVAGQLQENMSGLTNAERDQSLGRIFGNQQITAARILYAGGAADVQKWTDAVNDQGFAAETAATKMDNLIGDLERLKGALQTALIGTGESSSGPLRELVQLVTGLVDAYNSLPAPVKSGVLALAGLTAAIGLSVFAASRAVSAYGNFKTNLSTLGGSAGDASKRMAAMRGGALAASAGLAILASRAGDAAPAVGVLSGALAGFATTGGPWGAAIGGGVGLLATFAQANSDAKADVDALTATLDTQTGSITEQSRALLGQQLIDDGLVDNINQFGLSSGQVVDAMLDVGDAAERVRATLAPYSDAVAGVTTASGDLSAEQRNARVAALELLEAIGGGNSDIETAMRNFEFLGEATGEMGPPADDAAAKIRVIGGVAVDASFDVKTLTEAFEKLNAALSNRASVRDYEAAIDAAAEALKANGRTLNNNTEAGRANNAALDAIADTAIKHAQAVKEDTGSVAAQRKVIQGARDDLFDQARAFGMSKDEARDYINEVLKIPPTARTQVDLAADQAMQDARDFKALLDQLHDVNIAINVTRHGQVEPPVATGGYITGPGTSTSDSIPARLSTGEYVIRAAAVRAIGVDRLHNLNAQGFAAGGSVGPQPLTAASLRALLARPEDITTIREVNRLLAARNREEKDLTEALKHLHDVRKDASSTDKELAAAEKRVNDERADATEANDAYRQSMQDIRAETMAYVEQVQGLGSAFGGEATSLTAQGLLAKKRAVASDAAEFRVDLGILKRKHADGDLIAELKGEGPTQSGLALIRDLIRQPRSYFRAERRADARLDRSAREFAVAGVGGGGGHGGTTIQRQGNVNIEKVYWGPTRRDIEKGIRRAQQHALMIADSP